MLTVKDVLLEFDGGVLWPIKTKYSPLTETYRTLRKILDRGENYVEFGSYYSRKDAIRSRLKNPKDLVVIYQNESILKDLNNKKYIYLTRTKLLINESYSSHDKIYEYVAILKKEGVVGYIVLIMNIKREHCRLSSNDTNVYGGNFGLMEILADGTTILFNKTVSWEDMKNCRVNTTSIKNLFFNQEEISLVASVVDNGMDSAGFNECEPYFYKHGEGLPF